jgi:hypothetical protein
VFKKIKETPYEPFKEELERFMNEGDTTIEK